MADRVDEVPGEPAGEPRDVLRDAQPRVDRLEMDRARARAELSLFGSAAPATLGRYVLLGKSGDGGMGVVYAAYDPDLHRKVALKVLHPQQQHARAHERLIAEARALAKLDHPNVVRVHDVITHHEEVVLVMEWIEGETLATWERAHPRSRQAVVSIYIQAAHGLVAAHGVGVIHRDFKPANAILGSDGRVRVLDFGLAAPTDASTASPERVATQALAAGSVDKTWPTDLTATGAMVGTFAYAPPEQLQGITSTPASDQFSFAVALHRAVEGVAPFSGDDIASRCHAIQLGAITLAGDQRAVPAWLRGALRRALAADPGARFPSMQALLAELTRLRGWRRWRTPAAIGAAAAIAAIAIAVAHGTGDPLASCDGGVTDIDAVWNPSVRARISVAFAGIHSPGTKDTRNHVLDGFDGYRRRWTELHRDACVAHRRGEQSASLLDHRMACMRKHLIDLRSAVSVVSQIDAASAAHAIDVVAGMPPVQDCAEAERLQAAVAPPPRVVQDRVDRVRASLSQAAALDRAGRNAAATALANSASEETERIGYGPLIADAALLHGRFLLAARSADLATTALARALEVALKHHELAIAVEAGARKIFTEGMQSGDLAALGRDAAFLIPLSLGLPGDHFARPLLLNNIGSVYMAAGDRVQGLHYFKQAHDALADQREIDPELICIDDNLARLTTDSAAREALARGAWIRRRAVFGDGHLATLDALVVYARLTEDPVQALPLLAQACDSYAALHPELLVERAYCESYRAFMAEQLGDHDEALRIYDGVVALGRDVTDPVVRSYGALAIGSEALLRGDLAAAALAWKTIADTEGRSEHWWVRVRAAHAEFGLGTVSRLLHHDADAALHFERAIQSYRKAAAINEEVEYRARLRLAEAALTQVRSR